jgi:hypothetical protein
MRWLGVCFFATALVGCGADTPDTIKGRWELFQVTCDGVVTALPAGVGFRVTFGDDDSWEGVFNGGSCPFRRYQGSYDRDGLSITERPSTEDCGTTCTLPMTGFGTCAGSSAFTTTHSYRVSLSEVDVLETGEDSTSVFCPGGVNVVEQRYYRRLD